MKNGRKVIAFVFLSLASVSLLYAQHGVQAGLFSPSGNTLTVRAKPEFDITGKNLSGVNVTFKWLKSYGAITFTPAAGPFGIAVQDSGSDVTYNYKVFGATPTSGNTLTWSAGSENDLFTVQVNNGTGTGSFILTNEYGIQKSFYFEIGGVDSTDPTPFYLQSIGNVSLPIQLSSFIASVAVKGQAQLRWTTLSEINNYGFEVQKAADRSAAFESISGSFTAGNGTTSVKHDYAYVDRSYTTGNVYRLKQIDLSGSVHFTDLVDPLGVTGVADKPMPTVYSLSQNYPNPFNPSTTIEFALPKDSHVTLDVYNIIGQKIMTLVDEVRPAGYHAVKFDGTNLASGLYLYRLTAGQQTFIKKLLLMK